MDNADCDLSFDRWFDRWAKLAADDPASFEAARRLMIESLIESAPEAARRRLRGLQWRVDQVRAQAPSPMSACLRISNLMWDSVLGEAGLLHRLERPTEPRREDAQGATLLTFPPER